MANKLFDIQEMLLRQMERLDNDSLMSEDAAFEIARSNSLSNTATTYLKSINLQLRVIETANKNEQTKKSLEKEVGLIDEKDV